jgi:hypothetical protein
MHADLHVVLRADRLQAVRRERVARIRRDDLALAPPERAPRRRSASPTAPARTSPATAESAAAATTFATEDGLPMKEWLQRRFQSRFMEPEDVGTVELTQPPATSGSSARPG